MSTLLLHGARKKSHRKSWSPCQRRWQQDLDAHPHVELLDAVRREITCSGLTVAKETLGSPMQKRPVGRPVFRSTRDQERSKHGLCDRNWSEEQPRFFNSSGALCGIYGPNLLEYGVFRRDSNCPTPYSKLRRDLPRLITGAVAQLADLRRQQDRRFDAYQNTVIGDLQLHDLAIRSMDAGVIARANYPASLPSTASQTIPNSRVARFGPCSMPTRASSRITTSRICRGGRKPCMVCAT